MRSGHVPDRVDDHHHDEAEGGSDPPSRRALRRARCPRRSRSAAADRRSVESSRAPRRCDRRQLSAGSLPGRADDGRHRGCAASRRPAAIWLLPALWTQTKQNQRGSDRTIASSSCSLIVRRQPRTDDYHAEGRPAGPPLVAADGRLGDQVRLAALSARSKLVRARLSCAVVSGTNRARCAIAFSLAKM